LNKILLISIISVVLLSILSITLAEESETTTSESTSQEDTSLETTEESLQSTETSETQTLQRQEKAKEGVILGEIEGSPLPFMLNSIVPEQEKLKQNSQYIVDLFSGSLTYAYNIYIPPGTNKLQPELALVYASYSTSQRPSQTGTGWSLTQSSIQRNTNNTFSNNSKDDSFSLILNGISADLVYITSENQFHTTQENFLSIQNKSNGNNTKGEYWVVKTKDGTMYRFGFQEESEAISNQYPYVSKWFLDLVNDSHGNQIFYRYQEDPYVNDTGSVYLSKILYNNDQQRKIDLTYESVQRQDFWTVYEEGVKVSEARRLREINVSVGNALVRRYVLGYVASDTNARFLIKEITQYGNDSSALPPVQFTYNTITIGWTQDTNSRPPGCFVSRIGYDRGYRMVDVNGDGLVDLIYGRQNATGSCTSAERSAWINNKSGWTQDDIWEPPVCLTKDHNNPDDGVTWDPGYQLEDLNGDGLVDIFLSKEPDGSPGICDNDTRTAWINNGSGWLQDDSWEPPICALAYDGKDKGYRFLDLNGDGLVDIVKGFGSEGCATSERSAWINNATYNGTTRWVVDDSFEPPKCFINSNSQDIGYRFSDINGDGLVDVFYGRENITGDCGSAQRSAWLNNGSGFSQDDSWQPPVCFTRDSDLIDLGYRLADVNGDSLVDIVRGREDLSGCPASGREAFINTLTLNGETRWTRDDAWKPPVCFIRGDTGAERGYRLVDLNGDRAVDIWYGREDYPTPTCTDPARRDAWMNKASKTYLLKKITTEFGGGIIIDYTKSTIFNNTGKNTLPNPGNNKVGDLGFNLWVVANLTEDSMTPISTFSREVNSWGINNTPNNWNRLESITGTSGWFYKYTLGENVTIDENTILELWGGETSDGDGDCIGFSVKLKMGNSVNDAWLNTSFSNTTTNALNWKDKIVSTTNYYQLNVTGFSPSVQLNAGNTFYIELNPADYTANTCGIVATNHLSSNVERYHGYSASAHPDDPIVQLHTLRTVTIANTSTGANRVVSLTAYNYSGGFYDYPTKEFRGFGYAEEIKEDKKIRHWFYQDNNRKGLEYKTEILDPQSDLYQKTENLWHDNRTNGYVINQLRATAIFSYDKTLNPRITNITYSYDEFGNVISINYLGDTAIIGDEKYEQLSYVTNPSLWIVDRIKNYALYDNDSITKIRETKYSYDNLSYGQSPTKGDLTSKEDWLSGGSNPITSYAYDSYGNKITETNPRGHTTQYVYGIRDTTNTFPDRMSNAQGNITNYYYELGTGNLISIIDPNNQVTDYMYDSLGRIAKEILPYDTNSYPTKQYAYEFDGIAPEKVKRMQRETSGASGTFDMYLFYDGFGKLIQEKNEATNSRQIVIDTFYDGEGKIITKSNPYFINFYANYTTITYSVESTNLTYDVLGRVIKIKNPDGIFKSFNQSLWNITAYDENNHKKLYSLDAHKRITRVEEFNPNIQLTTYQYNPADLLVKITDDKGNTFNFTYDSLGRKTKMQDPDLGNWLYQYDANGNIINQTDTKGNSTLLQYDILDRVTNKTSASGIIKYFYDTETFGKLTRVNQSGSDAYYRYDNRLRPISEIKIIKDIQTTTTSQYDAMDRVISQSLPNTKVITYAYNDQGLVNATSGKISSITYNELNKPLTRSYNNNLITHMYYNTNNFRLTNLDTGTKQNLTYTYDNVGNVLTINDIKRNKASTFVYDSLDRLTSAQRVSLNPETEDFSMNFTYNSIGNILMIMQNGDNSTFSYGTSPVHAPFTLIITPLLLKVSNLSTVYANNSQRIFRFVITNNNNTSMNNISFTLDTGQSNITSTQSITLNSAESIFVYPEYSYTAPGTYRVIATARSGPLSDTKSIGIIVLSLLLFPAFIPSKKKKIKFFIRKISNSGKVKLGFFFILGIILLITVPFIASQNQSIDITTKPLSLANGLSTISNDALIEEMGNVSLENQITEEINTTNVSEAIEANLTEEENQTAQDTSETLIASVIDQPPFGLDSSSLGYEYLDNNNVLHMWNDYDDYYFNTTSGIQLTNHYNEYWTKNVLCIGYFNATDWNNIKCVDKLTNFNQSVVSDGATFINYTLWKNISYLSYNFKVTLRYNLELGKDKIRIQPFVTNLGISIPQNLGFAWRVEDIHIGYTYPDDFLTVLNKSNQITEYDNLSNKPLNKVFTNVNIYPFYIIDDIPPVYESNGSVLFEWDNSLTYRLIVKDESLFYNAPVTLAIQVGSLGSGQELSTTFFWHDAPCSVNCQGGNSITGASSSCTNCTGIEPEDKRLMRCRVDTSFGDGTCTTSAGCKLKWQYNQTDQGGAFVNIPDYDSTVWTRIMCNATLGINGCEIGSPATDVWKYQYPICKEQYITKVRCNFNGNYISSTSDFTCVDTLTPNHYFESDNSSGSVPEGMLVMTGVRWFDNGTLDTAVLRTNKTGVWQNESYLKITPSPACQDECDQENWKWANITISTAGYSGKNICWQQWANDTNNNWNTTMQARCFDVSVNETDGGLAIEQGIRNALPSASIFTYQQIYTINASTGTQSKGKFDKVALWKNQTWAFNYVTTGESFTNIGNLGRTVMIWENSSLSSNQITHQVEVLINSTRG